MPDKDANKKSGPDGEPTGSGTKGFSLKVALVVAGLMVAEGVGVFMLVGMTGKQPQAAEATQLEGRGTEDLEATVEVPLLTEKFQNMQTGRVWVWDTSIVLKVRGRNQPFVQGELERRQAEVQEGISMIFRKAPHSQLKEPGLETINRQITAYVNQVMGKDAEGRDRIERVVIPRCKGFPTD